ncbi:hypothetical protein HRbin02_00964 [Candidatus Calditenuaceae archaeon HR02]|nr:hypothetical protein HRbin02_00964 [Candidatus Calditenuaceae archaeon HR02]
MSVEQARRYCIDCFFGSRANINKLFAAARVSSRTLENDVNGIGITYTNGRQALAILLRRGNEYAQPIAQAIADQFGVPVTAIVAGELQSARPIPYVSRQRVRPAQGGVSIGHYMVTAGTLGCLVRDNEGHVYILSNNHVLANSNNARIGDPIYQPGPYDGGNPNDTIATLWTWTFLNPNGINYVDAALARPINIQDVSPDIFYIGKVRGVGMPTLSLHVKKSGRTTGLTRGVIVILRAYVKVNYLSLGHLTFDDQIVIQPGGFSKGGDSGSLVVDENNRAIGVLFAGSDIFSLANPINRVMQELNIASII